MSSLLVELAQVRLVYKVSYMSQVQMYTYIQTRWTGLGNNVLLLFVLASHNLTHARVYYNNFKSKTRIH